MTEARQQVMGCPPGCVHVWRVELGRSPAVVSRFKTILSCDQRERAARFQFDQLRSRWIVAHGALRMILARYAGMPPASLLFETGPYGKPALAGSASRISFNLSHTDDLALVAVTCAACVGIDAEIIREGIEWRQLSRSFFAPSEAAEIASLPPEGRLAGFFACWTRKEAFAKAVGAGLSIGLDSFGVSVQPDTPPRLLWALDPRHEPASWHFEDLSEPGVAAALAVRMPRAVVRKFDFVVPPQEGF